MSFHYKLAAFDLDGTLAESKKTVTESMAKLIYELSLETKVAIISGASMHQFEKQLLPHLKASLNIILLPVDGTERFEYSMSEKKWKMTDREIFPLEKKNEVKKVLAEIVASGMYGIPTEHYGDYVEDRDTEVVLSCLGQQAPLDKREKWDPERIKRMRIKEMIEARVKDVSVTVAGTTSIDILPNGFNKAKGLGLVMKKLGLDRADVIYVGDAIVPGGNDYSIEEAGIENIKVKGPKDTEMVVKKWLNNKVSGGYVTSPVAYFCSEYALTDDSSMYAGGLGILAGDYLLEIADKNIPFIAIGLKYGTLELQGFSLTKYVVEVPAGDEVIQAKVWHRSLASNVSVYLLDAGEITAHLYDSHFYTRLKQQMVLGIGGVRLLNMLGVSPSVYHLNEGHTATAGIAIAVEKKDEIGKIVASKHTILPDAGLRINFSDFEKYFGNYCERFGADLKKIFNIGLYDKDHNFFSTTGFVMAIARKKNAVSKLHAIFEKKRHPQSTLIPITNGVYRKRWQAPDFQLGTKEMPAKEILNIKKKLRTNLFDYVKKTTGVRLDPSVCTLVWARRFAAYKRPYLLFSDMERLTKIISNDDMPLQIVISGKAHEADKEGQDILEKIIAFTKTSRTKNRVVYVPDYAIPLANKLVQGADIWLNTPELGKEACGTSGIKAGLNGALQFSIQDGWVNEVSWDGKGWVLPEDNTASALYTLLEEQILPCFYKDPSGWVSRMRLTIGVVEKSYTTERMLDQYVKELYN